MLKLSSSSLAPARHLFPRPRVHLRRQLLTLAIESSCDDTCVAILEKRDAGTKDRENPLLTIHHHEKATSDNHAFRGVHPLEALHSHQENLAKLVQSALCKLPTATESCQSQDSIRSSKSTVTGLARKPDFVTVTRGPGMRSNLNAGLDFAKGLAVAWERPLVGVNHMQAHALTPRLVNALKQSTGPYSPQFPFLSLLISGGHTVLIHSENLNTHRQIASTADIAIGDAVDKMARAILPPELLRESNSTMYGPALEQFAFADGVEEYRYEPPASRAAEMERYFSEEGWNLGAPMAESKSGSRSKDLEFSFTGLSTAVERIMKNANGSSTIGIASRRELAKQCMRLAFEHLAIRARQALEQNTARGENIHTLVVSGGVAANKYLRHIMRAYLDARGRPEVQLVFPPVELCTDNAIMIGWTGIEIFEHGLRSNLSIRSLKKWSLDPCADDGGILGVSGWLQTTPGMVS